MKAVLTKNVMFVLMGVLAFGLMVSEATSAVKAPEDVVTVDEDVVIEFAGEPQHHFMRAYEHFLRHEWNAAAEEIRKGGAFLKLEAARADADTKKALTASVKMLGELADEVKSGAVRSAKDLQNAFAMAEQTLARHHYLKATAAWAKKEVKKAGSELRAAAASLEHGFAWAGQTLEALTIKVLDDCRHIGGKLVEGAGWTKDEVGKALASLGKEIDKLGKTLAG